MRKETCILTTWKNSLNDLVNLFFPKRCLCCGRLLTTGEKQICLHCFCDLPFTRYHLIPENPIEQLFAGKIRFEHASSCLHFEKDNRTQRMIHALKYHGNRQIGFWLGQVAAQQLAEADSPLCKVDRIIPVPLHRRRQFLRGYNQAEIIAQGMQSELHIPLDTTHLFRKVSNRTQTQLEQQERWLNVKDIFGVKHPEELRNQHLLLVDDVVTTGATLLSCAETLASSVEGLRISFFTIATAYK